MTEPFWFARVDSSQLALTHFRWYGRHAVASPVASSGRNEAQNAFGKKGVASRARLRDAVIAAR